MKRKKIIEESCPYSGRDATKNECIIYGISKGEKCNDDIQSPYKFEIQIFGQQCTM